MKNFAMIAATLICFAGCARNDTNDMGATDTTTSDTGYGTPASSQTDSATMTDTNSRPFITPTYPSTSSLDTNSPSSGSILSQDTNNSTLNLETNSSTLNLDTNSAITPPDSQTDEQITPPSPLDQPAPEPTPQPTP